ncbi:hypothetical protein [Metapseudomonas otitidis]|uniref:hypothetical protein n=1 Tax=Metapseudomonas otitidis TaxID=319939 RepID=UPI00209A6B6A|nr:hypothetical protein [Pseudomonas otitidis]MCO7557065.1 hypothetical protein [Pseudomonas otitidis]
MSRKKTYTYVRSMLAIRSSGRAYIQHSHSAEDLASTAAELMVYELGTKGAMEFFRKKLSEYMPDYKGLGRDHRPLKETIPTFQNPTMQQLPPAGFSQTTDRGGSPGVSDGMDG